MLIVFPREITVIVCPPNEAGWLSHAPHAYVHFRLDRASCFLGQSCLRGVFRPQFYNQTFIESSYFYEGAATEWCSRGARCPAAVTHSGADRKSVV